MLCPGHNIRKVELKYCLYDLKKNEINFYKFLKANSIAVSEFSFDFRKNLEAKYCKYYEYAPFPLPSH